MISPRRRRETVPEEDKSIEIPPRNALLHQADQMKIAAVQKPNFVLK